jgi:hypothetical protein
LGSLMPAPELSRGTSMWVACYARDQLGSFGFASFVARVRVGVEVDASPRLALDVLKLIRSKR